jgi:iron complex outermembrane receptor protein
MSRHTLLLSISLSALTAWPSVAQTPNTTEDESAETVIVQATRSGRSARDEPIRVEVIDREEIEEKLMMTPGNIAMMVSETPGIRTQITSPSLGAANIRIQGLKGRYTQLLADGLPIYGGQAPAIGLLQIPPTDLGRVEVIKGAASALYGSSALGGVINLVSRRPGDRPETDFVLNATSRNGQDMTGYHSASLSDNWGYSLTGGFDRQTRQDLNRDGWADMPGYTRWTARPRLFWEGDGGEKVFLTIGAMTEQREGGTLPGRVAPDGSPFLQALGSTRLDAGVAVDLPFEKLGTLNIRASGVTQNDAHRYGNTIEDDLHQTLFAEATLGDRSGGTSWLAGFALQQDRFRSQQFSRFDYTYTAPGLLAQIEQDIADDLTLAGSARLDFHSQYGERFSPRMSMLYHPGAWSFRATVAQGFFAPTPFVEEVGETGLSRLQPLDGLKAESARIASLDAGYAFDALDANLTLFGSDVRHAVQSDTFVAPGGNGVFQLFNGARPTQTRGAEVRLRYRWEALTVTGSYVYTDATEVEASDIRNTVPLTPRHSGGVVAMWEQPETGRLGIEAYYTGLQRLDDNPYRSKSRPYVDLGLFGEVVVEQFRFFINAENILNVRQTRFDPLLLPTRAPDGRWTVDAWAPTDGFILNGGVRFSLGGG